MELDMNKKNNSKIDDEVEYNASFSFDISLKKDNLAQLQLSLEDSLVVTDKKSILDEDYVKLKKMDINLLRKRLILEILSLTTENENVRKAELQKIFDKISSFLMDSEDFTNSNGFFIDLISTPELSKIDFIIDFLKNDYINNYSSDIIRSLIEFYSVHSDEAINNFNYMLKSSTFLSFLIKDPSYLHENIFSNRGLTAFNKEIISNLFRFIGQEFNNNLSFLFSEKNYKELFIISKMTEMIHFQTEHSSEFLHSVMRIFEYYRGDDFSKLLRDYYDVLVGNEENEEKFSQRIAENDPPIELRKLINYIIQYEYDDDAVVDSAPKTLKELMYAVKKRRELNNSYIFNSGSIHKIADGTFEEEKDFKKIKTEDELNKFKEAFLENIYGISLEKATNIVRIYGQYMKPLSEAVVEKDIKIYEILKSIINIKEINLYDKQFDDKIKILQKSYYEIIKKRGIDYQNDNASSTILESALNRMFINTYNSRLLKLDKKKVMEIDQGIPIYDAGLEFDMVITSLSGVINVFNSNFDMKDKWQSNFLDFVQGLCLSHISSQNLGVISTDTPFLGFANIPQYSLNAMGPNDIYSDSGRYNLRYYNSAEYKHDDVNRLFVPANIMSDETRFGYNELLIDRFLTKDENDEIKIQPDYIVFYKEDENYKLESELYKQSLKMAKDFNVPIVVVDIPKIKKHEKKVLRKKEKELLKSDDVNEKLLVEIVTRYMNNYTGSLTTVGIKKNIYLKDDEDFSVKGMEKFFDAVLKKIYSLKDPDKIVAWYDAVVKAYKLEQRKNMMARDNGKWNFSVDAFILDDVNSINLSNKLYRLKEYMKHKDINLKEFDYRRINIINKIKMKNDDYNITDDSVGDSDYQTKKFIPDDELTPESEVMITFFSKISDEKRFKITDWQIEGVNGKLIEINQTDNVQESLIENLIFCYFFENPYYLILNTFNKNYSEFKTISTNISSEFDLCDGIKGSILMNFFKRKSASYIGYNEEFANKYFDKIENMLDVDFIGTFEPLINRIGEKGGNVINSIEILLDKKNNIRSEFSKLNEMFIDNYENDRRGGKK